MIPEWMKILSEPENAKEFSQLTHDYYKLATMRIMQFLRDKYNIPKDDIQLLTLSIFSRMLNESCYSVGSNISTDYPITNFFDKKHLLTLVRVLNGEPLSQFDRNDIDIDIQSGIQKFKEFIINNASDFYVE